MMLMFSAISIVLAMLELGGITMFNASRFTWYATIVLVATHQSLALAPLNQPRTMHTFGL